jgi:hypothetical protein
LDEEGPQLSVNMEVDIALDIPVGVPLDGVFLLEEFPLEELDTIAEVEEVEATLAAAQDNFVAGDPEGIPSQNLELILGRYCSTSS